MSVDTYMVKILVISVSVLMCRKHWGKTNEDRQHVVVVEVLWSGIVG